MAGERSDMMVRVVWAVIDEYPQVQAAVRAIVAEQWGDDKDIVDRHYDIGQGVTDALHRAIGTPDPADPDGTRWEYLIIMNLIFHIPDRDLGKYCAERFGPDTA